MEVDTGAGFTVFSEQDWILHGRPELKDTNVQLRTYTGESIDIKGKFYANVKVNGQ